ncbi:hypothetical protein [Helicobacter ganmani]|uniref:hypothetical protein n=1 Tax=Helicobacter ganmani TaxID=60246 RepID=UPI003A85BD4E
MYSFNFYLFIFLFLCLLMMPFFLLGGGFIIYERIQAYLAAIRGREKKFHNINYLVSIFKDENSEQELLEEALAAFNQHFLHFGDIGKESKEYQGRLDFIGALSWCPKMDIDRVVNYREDLVKANPNFKKEIETVIGQALKNRDEKKCKKK